MKALTRRNFLQTAALATTATALAEAGSSHAEIYSEVYRLDGADWLLDVDPSNTGYSQGWAKSPTAQAKSTKVPWVIQGSFPDYHGFAWYWKEFDAPRNPHREGQYLIRFHGVDYLGEVFVNGTRIGLHEGGEEPFTVNVTAALRPGQRNLLAVRVLNPTHEPLDGIRLQEVAEGRRDYPHPRDNAYNTGGITNSVELLVTPPVHIEELHTVPDWKTGEVRVVAAIRNETSRDIPAHLIFATCPARASNSLSSTSLDRALKPGDNQVNGSLNIPQHRLWELNDPFLYHLTVRVQAAGTESIDANSVRFGFRDFRFAQGYFRLNGRRIYIHGALYTVLQYPISQTTPFDEDLLRRDVLNMKSLGFNSIRITCGAALPRQLDLMDEMGLLACEEHFGARAPANSQYLEMRWDRSIAAVVRRDRNHPCIVMWSLLNEVADGPLFRHVAQSLPTIRQLDQSRLIVLGSGRFDNDSKIGSLSNPGSVEWESNLVDLHAYPSFPHSARTIKQMRSATSNFSEYGTTASEATSPPSTPPPVLLSEYGVCGAQDYPRFLRNFEQLNEEHAADATLFREKWELFLNDWKRYKLDECWAQPEDYFKESQRNQATLAAGDYNAWNANPALVGDFNSTQITDAWFHGCGITNYFRELKPGMADVFSDMGTPIRWCLFADAAHLYRGAQVHLDAVLVNRDVLKAGEYPVRFQLVGPGVTRILDTTIMVKVAGVGQTDSPFAQPVFSKDMVVDGPPGIYRFSATFQKGAAAAGLPAEFYLADPASLPPVQSEVTLWGEDDALARWLNSRGIRVRTSLASEQTAREVILACGTVAASEKPALVSELARRVARGSSVIFLTPDRLLEVPFDGKHPQPLRWLPIDSDMQPLLAHTPDWYFHADPWAKEHPVFAGLPSGGILDYTFYRDIISTTVFRSLPSPLEAICGTIQTSGGSDDYCSDLLIAEYPFGAGHILLSNLRISENIGRVPAADRLLLNMLNYAARDLDKPVSDVPAGLNDRLRTISSASPQR